MAEHGLSDELRSVDPDAWLAALESARGEGFGFFDLLDAVDEIGRSHHLRVLARLVDFDAQPARGVRISTLVDRDEPHLPTCTGLFAGAAWHERELHDMFGITFDGGDPSPLLVHEAGLHPLRKDFVVAARAVGPWPGAKEPGDAAPSRRKMAPPGVPDAAVWGDRDPQTPVPTADELAAEISGGRVRRRR